MNLGSPKHQRKICVKHFMSRRFFFSNPSLKGTKSRFWQYLFFAYLGVLVRCCFVEFWIRNEIKCWFDLYQLIIGVLFSLTTFKGISTTNKLIEIASITYRVSVDLRVSRIDRHLAASPSFWGQIAGAGCMPRLSYLPFQTMEMPLDGDNTKDS